MLAICCNGWPVVEASWIVVLFCSDNVSSNLHGRSMLLPVAYVLLS